MNDNRLESWIEAAQTQLKALLHSVSTHSVEGTDITKQVQQLSDLLAELQTEVQPHPEELAAQHQALVQQYRRDRQFMKLAQQLRQSLDPHEIWTQTVIAVQELLQVDRVVIYQFKSGGEAVVVAAAELDTTASLLNQSIEAPVARELAQFCQQVSIIVLNQLKDIDQSNELNLLNHSDLSSSDRSSSDRSSSGHSSSGHSSNPATLVPAIVPFLQQQQATALLAAPIRREDSLFGIISVHQQTGSRSWQTWEIELLQQLSTEVAIALQHSKLYQQAQRLNLDLEQQVQQRTEQLKNALDYESMLKRITDRIRDSLDENHILQAAVQELTVILKLAGCNAALYDLNQGTSTIHYEYTQSIPASQGRVAQMQHFPEIYQQLQRGWYFQFCSLLPNPVRGRVAMLTCPIFVHPESSRGVDQSVLGDLWLIHHPDHLFDEHEIRLVQQVASQCAIAIRQARLYQAAQGQVQELAKLNRLKDEFLSTVSHELRTPITNVKMAIQMLRTASTEDKRAKYLSILEQEAVREADLINDLLDLQQLQAMPRPLDLEPVSLPEWLPKLLDPFQPRFAARHQIFQAQYSPALPPIISEPASLRRTLVELLNNACKYTAPGGRITLTINAHSVTELPMMRFVICNQATIPTVELNKIFDKFYRCPNADPWKQGGTGLGLALVKKLIERLQGTIQVTSADGWTKFTVELPFELDAARH